jgi:competence protein CoiA
MDFERFQDDDNGCPELKDGWARQTETYKKVHAEMVRKNDGPFICPACLMDAIHRRCYDKKDHFAHHAQYTPVGSTMGALHKNCQEALLGELTKAFPKGDWTLEREIPKIMRRPDISGRFGIAKSTDPAIVIEVQASTLPVNEIIERLKSYSSQKNLYTLFVIPLTREIAEEEQLRPRVFELFLHTLNYGRVYYWWEGLGGNIVPIHWGTAFRYIEEKTWYEDGCEQMAGGYDKPYKTLKRAQLGRTIPIHEMAIRSRSDFQANNKNMSIPPCSILLDPFNHWWDKNKENHYFDKIKDWEKLHDLDDYLFDASITSTS